MPKKIRREEHPNGFTFDPRATDPSGVPPLGWPYVVTIILRGDDPDPDLIRRNLEAKIEPIPDVVINYIVAALKRAPKRRAGRAHKVDTFRDRLVRLECCHRVDRWRRVYSECKPHHAWHQTDAYRAAIEKVSGEFPFSASTIEKWYRPYRKAVEAARRNDRT
jgi:hypothetical protein